MIRRVGFACIGHNIPYRANYSTILRKYTHDRARELLDKNIEGLYNILKWMEATPLRLYRISSDFIPFASHEVAKDFDGVAYIADRLLDIGNEFTSKGFRFSFHPGQYTVLNSLKPGLYEKSILEIEGNCDVLDAMGLDNSHKIVIHVGGAYKDIDASTERAIERFGALSDRIKSRLIIENDDKIFAYDRVVKICEKTGIPPIFDIHHHFCNPAENINGLLERGRKLWGDVRPKMHISSQLPNSRKGRHDNIIFESDIDRFLDLVKFDVDLMIEAKHKEQAAIRVARYLSENKGWTFESSL